MKAMLQCWTSTVTLVLQSAITAGSVRRSIITAGAVSNNKKWFLIRNMNREEKSFNDLSLLWSRASSCRKGFWRKGKQQQNVITKLELFYQTRNKASNEEWISLPRLNISCLRLKTIGRTDVWVFEYEQSFSKTALTINFRYRWHLLALDRNWICLC